MSIVIVTIVSILAIFVALALAFVPIQLALKFIGRNVAAPIRRLIERQRDRRHAKRETPDRRRSEQTTP